MQLFILGHYTYLLLTAVNLSSLLPFSNLLRFETECIATFIDIQIYILETSEYAPGTCFMQQSIVMRSIFEVI